MIDISPQLRGFFQSKGLTQEAVASRFGVSQAYVSGLISGKRPFGKATAARWAEEFGFSEAWLLTGTGPMMNTGMKRVPLVPETAFAGGVMAISDAVSLADCEEIVSPIAGASLAIRVSGDSMAPVYPDGCVVFLKQIDERLFIPWGYPHVIDTVNGAYLKKVYPIEHDPSIFSAQSINPAYPPFTIPFSAVNGFYQVLGALYGVGVK